MGRKLSTNWKRFSASNANIVIEFTNDKGSNDVFFRAKTAADIRHGAKFPGWKCGTSSENNRCELVRNGGFYWGGSYQIEFKTSMDNIVEENAPGVGGWGGSCTCPDGSVYQVGDNIDHCDSLACIGGVSGTCNRRHGVWSRRKVTCGAQLAPFESAPAQSAQSASEVHWVADGCGTNNFGGAFAPNDERHGVRCCSNGGSTCKTTFNCRSGNKLTFQEAEDYCANEGLRVCTKAEIDSRVCCGSGGGCDHFRVWTSTESQISPSSWFELLRPGVECNNNRGEFRMGVFHTVERCAEKCKQRPGCTNFVYGKGDKEGECWDEGITEKECTEWQPDQYDFYKLKRDDIEGMKYLGTGFCTSGYYKGWDGKGIESPEACVRVCLSERQCVHAAFLRGRTCSRYDGLGCHLTSNRDHITYTKRTTNTVVNRAPRVGHWGGSCTCPEGSVELAIDALVRGRNEKSFAAPQNVEACSTTLKVTKIYHQKKLYENFKRTYCSCYDDVILE